MKLNPQQAPLYGECVLTVQLNDEECVEDEEDVEFYLLFAGTTQRHLTTTLRVSHVTLQAVCPAHDRGETVRVTLCQARPGGSVDTVAEEQFQFVQDLALDVAHILLSASGQRGGLEVVLLLDECQIPLQECERLDETLTLALRHIPLPPGWSVLGTDINTHSNTEPGPHETLLHFAARRGLRRVALFLLQQPGGPDALKHQNKQGHTPAGITHKRGHSQLQHLLSELEKSPRTETKGARTHFPEGRAFLHHPRLNTFTLTVDNGTDASPPDLQTDVEELKRYIQSHQQEKGLFLSVPLILSRDICDCSQKAARTSCPGPSLQNLSACEHQEAEAEAERENGELLNCIQSEEPEKVGLSLAGEGVCLEGRGQSVDISCTSCGELQQEEAGREVCVITVEQKEHISIKTHNKPQSGNPEEAAMGQSQGLLPSETNQGSEKSEESRRRDLPKEKERAPSSGQETADLSTLQQGTLVESWSKKGYNQADCFCVETETDSGHLAENLEIIDQGTPYVNIEQLIISDVSKDNQKVSIEGTIEVNSTHFSTGFGGNPEVNAFNADEKTVGCSERRNEPTSSPEKSSGNQSATIKVGQSKGFSASKRDSALYSISSWPNMAPGPVHKVWRELSQPPDYQKPEEVVIEAAENIQDPGEQDQEINQMTVSSAATASAIVRDLTDKAGSSDDVSDRVDNGVNGLIKSVAVVPSTFEEGNGGMAPSQVTPGGAQSSRVIEYGAGETRKDERYPSSNQATFGETPSQIKDVAPSSDEATVGEESDFTAVDKAKSPSEEDTVGETSLQLKDVSHSGELTIGEMSLETKAGVTPQKIEDPCPFNETAVQKTLSRKNEYVSPLNEAEFGETLSRGNEDVSSSNEDTVGESEDAFHSGEADVKKTLVGESEEASLFNLTALMEKLSVESKDVSPLSNSGVLERSSQRCDGTMPANLTAVVGEISSEASENASYLANSGAGETSSQKSEALTPSKEAGVTETLSVSYGGNHAFNESQNKTGLIRDTSDLAQDQERSKSPQNEALPESQSHKVSTPVSKPNKVSCYPSETTSDISANSENIPHQQQGESNDEMLALAYPCDSMPKENNAEIITFVQQFEVVTSGAEGQVTQAPGPTNKARDTSSNSHTQSAESNETREDSVNSNIASQACDSTLTSPCDSCGSQEGNIQGISLDPQSETFKTEGHVPAAPLLVSTATVIELSNDSGCSLGNTLTSGTLRTSNLPLEQTLPLDKDCGTTLGLDTSSPVEVDSGLSHDLPSSVTEISSPEGLCEGNSLNEKGNQTEGECRGIEESHKEQVAVDHSGLAEDVQASLTNMDQTVIHRETEVFYPLESCLDVQEKKQPSNVGNTSTGGHVEDVCWSVSVSLVVDSESISDEDSLLSVETTDDNVFKQSEDTVTLSADSTSGVFVTGSSSTDDSSSLEPCGSEPQPGEGTLMVESQQHVIGVLRLCSDLPIGGAFSLGSDQPVNDTLSPVSDHHAKDAFMPGLNQPVGDAPTPETEEEEKKDRLTEVPERSAILRSSVRSLSPLRRHSWGPGKNSSGEADTVQRNVVQSGGGGKPAGHRRSMSWCPSDVPRPETDEVNTRSYSLEGLTAEDVEKCCDDSSRPSRPDSEEKGSLVSLTEKEQESDMGDVSGLGSQSVQCGRPCAPPPPLTLTKSISMSVIIPRDLDDLSAFTRTTESLENSISEEDPGPLRSDSCETRAGGTKVSRTFSYFKSKMSKKSKEKDREKNKDGKEKEKKSSSGHLFSSDSTVPPSPCLQCTNCSAHIHRGCREGLPVCAKVKMKQQHTVPDSASAPGVNLRSKSVTGRPWSTIMVTDDQMPAPPVPPPQKSPGIVAFNSSTLSKSISISNIAGQMDDASLKGLKFLSQSTDSLHKVSKVNQYTESLTDEGTELMVGQLMWDFEADAKDLEADSWSSTVDKKYLKQLKKDVVKRQDVIYGLQKEMQLEQQTLERMFPVLEELLNLHTDFFTHLLERKRAEQAEKDIQGGYIICRIGDVLLKQVTGLNADRMTKVYGKFCSRHNEAVNLYKELHTKDKRFQAFIKKTMSSSIVRRLSIPECILLVTQRITKYPVLLQRILHHTKDLEEEQLDTAEALQHVKEVIAAVDLKVSEYEKRQRLKDIHSRTDSKSIMRMKSGQMFAKEDLIRGRRLVHDGALQLKNTAGRLKDVQALLLSDVFVFLQEKDQKYVFASLDQRSTVISLRKLIVREVANEERGLFLITAGMEMPEMVEVYASSKVERNTWIQLIQNTMQSIENEDDEGIPSENEEDKRIQEVKAKEKRDQLQKRDELIINLLKDKVCFFRELCECGPAEDTLHSRMMFRANPDEVTKGEPILNDALKEVEKLQELVRGSVCGAVVQQVCVGQESVCVSPVSLPRRAETFGGFDSHQMNSSKTKDGEKEEADELVDLRRTESDSDLKKGGDANLLLLLKRHSEQVLQSVTRLHDLLNMLQAVVVQQDTFIEEQRQALNDLPFASSRHHSVSSSSSSSSFSRPASLIEQEKQRSAERLRQEAEERRRKEKEWEQKEKEVQQREECLHTLEEENARRCRELDKEKNALQNKKQEYQRDLARLRDSQRRLEREKEQLYTQSQLQKNAEDQPKPRQRTSSSASEDSLKLWSSTDPTESVELSSSHFTHDLLSRLDSKRKSKNLNLFSSGPGQKGGTMVEPRNQMPSRLLQLSKPKEKKEKKKKKKGKGQQNPPTETQSDTESSAVFFC